MNQEKEKRSHPMQDQAFPKPQTRRRAPPSPQAQNYHPNDRKSSKTRLPKSIMAKRLTNINKTKTPNFVAQKNFKKGFSLAKRSKDGDYQKAILQRFYSAVNWNSKLINETLETIFSSLYIWREKEIRGRERERERGSSYSFTSPSLSLFIIFTDPILENKYTQKNLHQSLK